jgi:GAF domain-containing protein
MTPRNPKTTKSKRRIKSSEASGRGAYAARGETEVARLSRELDDALERQAATSEVLSMVSSSSGELDPIFHAILEKATRICEANVGLLFRLDNGVVQTVVMLGLHQALADVMKPGLKPGPNTATARAIRTGRPIHIPDIRQEKGYLEGDPMLVTGADKAGIRSLLAVPMVHNQVAIGSIAIYRTEVRPFSDKQIALVTNFAAQAVIAIENARLLNELRQRTDDLTEALEQQTATSEVLGIISSSPGELDRVFQGMLENAVRICEAKFGFMLRFESDAYHTMAALCPVPEYVEEMKRGPLRPHPDTALGQVARTRQVAQIADITAHPLYAERDPIVVGGAEIGGIRTIVAVPILKDEQLIGVITIFRQEVRPFTDKQIDLVKNFAAQAVIAIENARLLNELRQRTTDLTEALDRQTATSDVLQVISSSPGDLEPVFARMLDRAARICGADFGNIFRWDGDALHLIATHNTPAALAEARGRAPFRPTPDGTMGRVLKTKTAAHVTDLAAEQQYIERSNPGMVAAVELGGIRTILLVPMLKEKEPIGIFSLYRQEVRPFTDKQIALVENFAAQAVIAIENARLLGELRQRTTDLTESLEQQTATSEVLQIISSSPSELEPVFATMLEKAVNICDAGFGNIYRWEGDELHLVALHNTPPAFAEYRRRSPIGADTVAGRMVTAKAPIHVADLATDRNYIERVPQTVAAVELGGVRTFLAVPMLKDNEFIGALVLSRQEVRPFTDKQIALVTNFAAQAVIAIENARLLNELRQRTDELSQRTTDLTEALEQQTATSDVLQVISSSPGDLEPVFATMLQKALRICDAKWGTIHRWDGDALQLMATHNLPPAFTDARSRTASYRPHPKSMFGRMIESRAVVHFTDAASQPAYVEKLDPVTIAAVELGGVRTVLGVPMLQEDELIGGFAIARQEVRPFTDKQIELVQNFAAQAVIAIENTRLLNELRDRTVQLEVRSQEVVKLNQQLEQRVSDQVGEIERMSRLRRFLPPQVADLIVASGTEKQLESHRREITALFCDLRGFTGFTESADAEDVIALLREYHAAIGEKIIKYSGTLERYAGDGVMVVFNDPVPVENPALQAVLMALEMRDAIGALTGKWRRFGHDIGFGIGIAHGYATLGTIGFEGRFDYAAIGTVSNVASRLCDEAKPGQILISPRVLVAVEDAVKVEPVGEFELKGIRRPLAAYNVVGAVLAAP